MVNSAVARRSIDDRCQPRSRCLLPTSLFSLWPRLSPLFATLTRTSQKSEKSDRITSFFSTKRFHSFSLFVTLKLLSPLFATLTKSTPGDTLRFLKFSTNVLSPLDSALTKKGWGVGSRLFHGGLAYKLSLRRYRLSAHWLPVSDHFLSPVDATRSLRNN